MPQLENPGFQLIPFPRSRMFVIDAAHVAAGKHMIHGLVELDVTEARGRLRAHRERTGESLSFTCLLYTSPSPRDRTRSRMPSSP